VINFVREKKQEQETSKATQGQNIDPKTWKFFDDEAKKELNTESVLKFATTIKASDIHLSAGKPITYRIE